MLTREEARAKSPCPYRVMKKPSSDDVNLEQLESLLGKKVSIESVLEQIAKECLCIAENCPRWKDEFVRDDPCKEYPCKEHRADCYENVSPHYPESLNHQKLYIEYCLNCPKHFGRCGG